MLKLLAVAVLTLAACTAAYPAYPWGWGASYGWPRYPYHPYPSYHSGGFPYAGPHAQLIYYGEFDGTCQGKPDGLYYVDERSFAYCTHQRKSVQPCAAGSRNPDRSEFKKGEPAHYYQFCSVIEEYQPPHPQDTYNTFDKDPVEKKIEQEVQDNIYDSVYEEGFDKVYKERR